MSKAFTSEDGRAEAPRVRPAPRLAPGEVRYVTPEGHAALRAGLARLGEERTRVAALPEPERTARLADVDARAAALEGTLATLTVLGPERAPEGTAAFATWVTVEDAAGRRTTFRLVGPDEADPRAGLVSVASPVGRALLGRTAGETVEVASPGGVRELTVIEVRRTHTSAPP